MKNNFAKIALFIVLITTFFACNAVKKVPENEFLLVKNTVYVGDTISKDVVYDEILVQKPNTKLLGAYLALGIYNLAKENQIEVFNQKFLEDTIRFKKLSKILSKKQVYRLGESFLYDGVNNFLRNFGEAPVVVNPSNTKKSAERLSGYFFDKGFFNRIEIGNICF